MLEARGGEFELTGSDDSRLDPSVVAALYVKHADELRAFLTGVLRDGELAGETLQATFAKAVEQGHTARQDTLKGWLFRVAYNEAMGIRRRQQTQKRAYQKLAWNHDSSSHSPEDAVVRWEQVESVRAALKILPTEQQQVVCMRIYDEKTFQVIADELNLPLGTVLTRMRLALKKLAACFESDESS
ncbi:MAG: RNA polymerase sigma factor [Planctomycetaceae bacterium]|nr:RNA polymerase sigma factor [Planctomycetaceae bacterium]MBT6487595.1 RNA polymerase sigma factor [Planctomycetaceae bacterium]MBT6493407.1 RNA polymerase sigma factor [Planctomycetaceae bacterium]